MNDHGDFEERLGTWLRARDEGPAPEYLRMRVAHVTEEPRRSGAVAGFVRPVATFAALAAAVAMIAFAVSLRSNGSGLPGAAANPAPDRWAWAASSPLSPAAVLVAALLLSAGGLASMAVVFRHEIVAWRPRVAARPRWRRVGLRVAGGIVAVAVLAFSLNVAATVRYPGGPLCEQEDCGPLWARFESPSGVHVSGTRAVGEKAWDWVFLHNPTPWPMVLERLSPRVSDPALIFDGAYLQPAKGDPVGPGSLISYPLTLESAAGDNSDWKIRIDFHASEPGPHHFAGIDIDYRIGPFAFHTLLPNGVLVCATPLPAGYACPVLEDFAP